MMMPVGTLSIVFKPHPLTHSLTNANMSLGYNNYLMILISTK